MPSLHLLTLIFCILFFAPATSRAERLAIAPADIWEAWTYPAGALHLDPAGALRPVLIRKDINPLAGATIRGAGAALATADRAFDGDPATGWSPSAGTSPEDWWIEIDLGQVFPLQQIRLRFYEDAPPLGFFTLSMSKGEHFINNANIIVEGTLLYSASERFAFNEAHELTVDLEDELVQVIRIEATRAMEGAPVLAEIEAKAFGDNIAFDLIAKGGSVDVEAAIEREEA